MTALSAPNRDWLLNADLAPAVSHDEIRPLYEAAGRGELALPFCGNCGLALELEQQICDGCGNAERHWRPVVRRGIVHAATTMYRAEPGLVHADHPYPVIDVELDSGHRIIMTTASPASGVPPIGATVHIGFRRLGDVVIPAIDNQEDTQ